MVVPEAINQSVTLKFELLTITALAITLKFHMIENAEVEDLVLAKVVQSYVTMSRQPLLQK